MQYVVSKAIKDQLDFFIYPFGNQKRTPRTVFIGGLPIAEKYKGLRSMIYLTEKIVIMGPLGLLFLLYNTKTARNQACVVAIAAEEKSMKEKKAEKEE